MEFNIETRKKQLESLEQFVTASKSRLQSILSSLGWSIDKIKEKPNKHFLACPYNAGHKVPEGKIREHIEKCHLKLSGYDPEEKFLSEPGCHPKQRSIQIDTIKKIEILSQAVMQTPYFQTAWNGQDPDPKTVSRLLTTFSKDERLALYEYCIANTESCPELPEFDTSVVLKKDENEKYSEEALLSFQRDLKRRSVKYKPIHTFNKNYKDVLREIINSQMEQYKDWLTHKSSHKSAIQDEVCEPQDILERPCSSTSRVSNNSSGSHSTSKKHNNSSRNSRNHSREPISKEEAQSKHNSKSKNHKDNSVHNNDSKECYEESSKSQSRGSSIHSSYKGRKDNSKNRSRRRSRSLSSNQRNKHNNRHRSRSQHRSRSRNRSKNRRRSGSRQRSKERQYDGRKKSRRYNDRYKR